MPLLLLVAIGIPFVNLSNFSTAASPSIRGFSTSVLLLTYAFSGFEGVPIPAGETRDPTHNVPFALFTTLAVITVLYVLIQIVAVGTLPELITSSRPLADVGRRVAGVAGGVVISLTAIVSIAGNLNGHLLSLPRILFAMAEQGQAPPFLLAVHSRFRTPHVAILLSAGLVLVLALSGTFIGLVGISVVTRLNIYGVTCAALPRFRRKVGVAAPTFVVPFGAVVAFGSVILVAWLLSNSASRDLMLAALLAAVGLALYSAFRMATRMASSAHR